MTVKPIPSAPEPNRFALARVHAVVGLAAALVALCVVARLLPHPPNFAPATAIALFGCLFFARRWQAAAVVAIGMAVGDWFLGFYDVGVMLTVYLSLLMPLAARRFLAHSTSALRLAGALRLGGVAVLSGIGFYLTTNAAVWFFTDAYPATAEGLAASYLAGLPFLKWTLAGNLFWSAALFGLYEVLRRGAGKRTQDTAHA